MFYSQYILAKRGPLGTIWIAAHLDRRLRKQQITETDVAQAVRECPDPASRPVPWDARKMPRVPILARRARPASRSTSLPETFARARTRAMWHTSASRARPRARPARPEGPATTIFSSRLVFWQPLVAAAPAPPLVGPSARPPPLLVSPSLTFLPAPFPFLAESIINPDAPLALRLSGQLMLGVVRVYSRKVNYLFQDCSEALVKIKQVFVKDRDVDLPEGAETAPTNTITLPENYDDLELFFEPDAAAGLGHGASGSSRSASSAANRVDITLEDPDAFDDGFEEQYAYDDRIVGDDDDDFIDDEIDTELRPTPGFRTPGSTAPRPFGETDPNERVDVQLEDYDEADVGGGFGPTPGGPDDDGGVIYRDDGDDDIAPLPLDDDLEDENGVRGTRRRIQDAAPGLDPGRGGGRRTRPTRRPPSEWRWSGARRRRRRTVPARNRRNAPSARTRT